MCDFTLHHRVTSKWSFICLEVFPRLGIGATVPKESKFTQSSNPVERKLLAKLHNDRRKISMKHEDLAPSAKNGNADEDSEEEESESKARAFTKKRPLGPISLLHAKKKHR